MMDSIITLPVEFGKSQDVRITKHLESRLSLLAGHPVTVEWNDYIDEDEKPATFAAVLIKVFGMPEDLALAVARAHINAGRTDKEFLSKLLDYLVAGYWPLPIPRKFESFGLVVSDKTSRVVIKDLHKSEDGQEVLGLIDTSHVDGEFALPKELPPGVVKKDLIAALKYVRAGAEVIITDSPALADYLKAEVDIQFVTKSWMHVDFSGATLEDVRVKVMLLNGLQEVYGIKIAPNDLPAIETGGRTRFTQPLITWTHDVVSVYTNGWGQLYLALSAAVDSTFLAKSHASKDRKFSGTLNLFPCWDDNGLYGYTTSARRSLEEVSARVVKQTLRTSGRFEIEMTKPWDVADVLPLVRASGYPRAAAHDQGASIYLDGHGIGYYIVTAEEAEALNEKGLTRKDGTPFEPNDLILCSGAVEKKRKRHTLFRGVAFEAEHQVTSKLSVLGVSFEGALVDCAIFPTALGAQAGDAIIADNALWQEQSAHYAFHEQNDEAPFEIRATVREGDWVEKGAILFASGVRVIRSEYRGRVVAVDVTKKGDNWLWYVGLREERRGGHVKGRSMSDKFSAHSYRDELNPWKHDLNEALGLKVAVIITHDGSKAFGPKGISYGHLQLICDTLGIELDYNPVAHLLGEYDHILELGEELKTKATFRWVMTEEGAELWNERGVDFDAEPVDDGCGGTLFLTREYIECLGEERPVLYQETYGYVGKKVMIVEASGVEDAVGTSSTPLDVAYWFDAVGCHEAAVEIYERGQEEFDWLRRLQAMNIGTTLGEALVFNFDTDEGQPGAARILAEGAEDNSGFRRLAEKLGTPFVKLIAGDEAVVLDLEVLDRTLSKSASGLPVNMSEVALALLNLISTPDSETAVTLMLRFKAQLKKRAIAPGTQKSAHRGALSVGAKRRGYAFIPYGEIWVTEGGPVHRKLTESMGIDWKEELARHEETGVWSLDGRRGFGYRPPIPVASVVTYRVVGVEWKLSPYTLNENVVQGSKNHGDFDGDGFFCVVFLNADAPHAFIGGEAVDWLDYQKARTISVTQKSLAYATWGEHMTLNPAKLKPGMPVGISADQGMLDDIGSILHQTIGIGRKFNHAFTSLVRASGKPELEAYALYAYLGGYEVTLGGYDPKDWALCEAMFKPEAEKLRAALLNADSHDTYLSEMMASDKIVRTGRNIQKWGNEPRDVRLTAGEVNSMFLAWGLRLMGAGELYQPMGWAFDETLWADVPTFEEGKRFLSTLVGTEFVDAICGVDPEEAPVSIRAMQRYLTELLPVLADYAEQDAEEGFEEVFED